MKIFESEISTLLGRNPGPILRGRSIEQQAVLPEVPAGLPSSLLERRPDVRAAEQELVSANARIGEAKALLYPQLSLTGAGGVSSSTLDGLFNGPAVAWSLVSGLVQPLFNAGKNTARVEFNESQMRQTLYFYESTIQQAFREVEDGLITYRKKGEQRVSQKARVLAERQVLNLAELRYQGGTASYLEVLDAQRSLFSAELDEVAAISDQLKSMVQLYKALGGGWSEEVESDQDMPRE